MKVDLGHSWLARNRVSPLRHIVEQTPDGWAQICTGQKAARAYLGNPSQSNCPKCKAAHQQRTAA